MNPDWLLEQKLIATLGGVLFVLLVVAMLVTKAGITRRRIALLVVVGIVFSTTSWVLNGALVRPGRSPTLIASCRTDKDKLQAGINALKLKLSDHARLVLFRGTASTTSHAECTTLRGQLAASLPVEGSEPVTLESGTVGGQLNDPRQSRGLIR